MAVLRFGILSTANIAQKALIPAIQRANNAEVKAIASGSGKAGEVARSLHIPKTYDSYEALLEDPEIDAVYIPLPNHLHKEWVIKAAQAGKHVLVEKPAALNARDTKEMVDACRQHGVTFMEAFMYQFHPQHERVKEVMASGEIGEVQLMRASFSFYLGNRDKNIRMDPEKGGGSIYDIGCYCLHTFRNILGKEAASVMVKGEVDSDFGVDTSAYGIIEMENGIPAMFDCSFNMPFRTVYEVIGTKGKITVPRAYRPDNEGDVGIVRIEKDEESREEKMSGDQYKLQVEHFSKAAMSGGKLKYTGEHTIRNMELIDACYESLRQNKEVEVKNRRT